MQRDPQGVVVVLPNGGHGGMQSQAALIASELANRGWHVTVAVGDGQVDGLAAEVSLAPLPAFSTRRPWRFVRALRRVSREASVLHGHGLRLAPVLSWTDAPVRIVSCHGLDPSRAARTVRRVRRRRVTFVSCGEGPRGVLAAHGLTSVVIDNAMAPLSPGPSIDEVRREFDLTPAVPLAVLPARYSHQKNHADLLRALALVRDELGPQSPEVLCFGDGPLRDAVATAAARDGDRPLARCLPYRPAAAALLAASDFFVLTSTWEGQPQVVLEALARGLPVASTTPTGLEDLIRDGRNGRLVRDVGALAKIIVDWTNDPASRPSDPALNASIVATHQLVAVVDRWEAQYRALAAAPR